VVCAITTLDFDHIRLLGSTLPEIAWHKAGIAKEHSVLLSVPQPPEALDVIRQRCADKKVMKLELLEIWRGKSDRNIF
jgi:folylpolyglutamate synthase